MIKGKIRCQFLKEGGITVTMSISEEDAASIDHELMDLRKSEVVLIKADEAVLSRHDEIHEARKSLEAIAGNTEAIRSALEVAEARLPLTRHDSIDKPLGKEYMSQDAGAGEQGGPSHGSGRPGDC